MNTQKTAIMVVLDRSGSMASLSSDVVGGFDEMVKEQRAQPGEHRFEQELGLRVTEIIDESSAG